MNDRPIACMRVLVADDNRDGADSLVALLRLEFGCEVNTAYDGEQALRLALDNQPDVLILDLQMPHFGGVEVAKRLRATRGNGPQPLMLAMTGRTDFAEELNQIDGSFDRAFAKPLNHAVLFAAVHRHWDGPAAPVPAVPFEFFETFTRAAREVMPLMAAKRQQVAFDSEGASLTLRGDPGAFHSAFYRLMHGLLDLMGAGIAMFTAWAVKTEAGDHRLVVNISGSGVLMLPEHTADVLARLHLTDETLPPGDAQAAGARRAHGVCPNSGGRVSFSSQASEGIMLRLELLAQPVDAEPMGGDANADANSDAKGARAWIVDHREVAPAVLERRLQRLGWRVWRFASCIDATQHLRNTAAADGPNLLIVRENQQTSPSDVHMLQRGLPAGSHFLLLVGARSSALRGPAMASALDVCIEPLSQRDLAALTRLPEATDAARAGAAIASRGMEGRSKVLVVDDHEINRVVARGLLQALGYEVVTASDGLDAIEHCKHMPPDLVLMDLNMPVLGGIAATRRIRELQKSGRIAPFAIVAATANDDPETMMQCHAVGMSGYLTKPLRLDVMRDELRRVSLPAG